MYPSLPKYFRLTAQQQQQPQQPHSQQHLTTPNNRYHHQHSFSINGSSSTAHHQLNANLSTNLPYGHTMPVNCKSGTYEKSGQQQVPPPRQKAAYIGSCVQRRNSNATDSCRNYWIHNHNHNHNASAPTTQLHGYRSERHHAKRKSAVELLAESKQFFVKSDLTMGDNTTNYGQSNALLLISSKRGRHSSSPIVLTDGKYNPSYGEIHYRAIDVDGRRPSTTNLKQQHQRRFSHIHHHHRHNHHSAVGCRPLNTRPLTYSTIGTAPLIYQASSHSRDNLPRLRSESYVTSDTIHLNETKAVSFEEDMAARLPPPLCYSQQSFDNIAHDEIGGEEPLVLTENYRPISPPAEYAEEPIQCPAQSNAFGIRYNYQRSYSHSHEMTGDKSKCTATVYNINSHKSLPDLHTQINRHSPHSEILSCCSRGNRSIKSTGESSLNRDSGGSSGHYTHRSEPCYRQYREIVVGSTNGVKKCCNSTNAIARAEYRRDSGSSTQHSNASYCEYICKADMEKYNSSDYLLNFTTPEVPEAFQDDYVPPTPLSTPKYANEDATRFNYGITNQSPRLLYSCSLGGGGGGGGGGKNGNHRASNTSYIKFKSASDEPIIQSPGSTLSIEDISPPPIQFRRQKCIRFKNHNRISLPQPQPAVINGSSGSNRLIQRRSEPPHYFFPKCFSAEEYTTQMSKDAAESTMAMGKSLRRSQEFRTTVEPPASAIATTNLEKFFDRLGLQDDKFREIYAFSQRRHSESGGGDDNAERINNDSDNSTVFFSDVSTVDSMRLPDSTETQPQATQAYRPTDPPSIVERNARIIKWLCNIRKAQGEII